MTEPCRIILDVDTGIDDALAIVYALAHPEITLEAVTTTYGNVDVEQATLNTLALLQAADCLDVPVAAGAKRALTRPYNKRGSRIHGPNGFGGIDLPSPERTALDTWAPDLLIEMAHKHPGKLTLVPTGPITNVALALMKAPEIATLFKRIVIMGGSIWHPGVPRIPSPMADANFFNDPESARIVLQSGADIILVGMDVTMKTLFTDAMMDRIEKQGGFASRKCAEASRFYLAAYRDQYPDITGCALHDPLAVAVAHDPTLVTLEPMQIDVECAGELTRGQVIPDRRRTGTTIPNAAVCVDVNVDRFVDGFVNRLATFGQDQVAL
ncbi:nucleoside hydrolase [Plastorhodobacter daqingensis]|uniref:Inosine/uridine-preferring nucleoside hydrolase n=2 Tax=Rhodobacterales TaxID=204455 RepID=A0A0B5DT99_9RHOB|nr:nucleoside hydrolase [Celeribacter indicus]AJE46658.1 Inosine/uridine-preferring nucleoside hydrolase [Celeribacter indicus]SDX56736.1 purine nucleosidase [Celeribacter indicus]